MELKGTIEQIKLCNRQDIESVEYLRIQTEFQCLWLKLFQHTDVIDRAIFGHNKLWPFIYALSMSRFNKLPFIPHVKEHLYNSHVILNSNQLWMTRMWEYPWCLSNIALSPNITVLDVGSGHSLFPLYLAHHGAKVTAADNDRRETYITAPALARILNLKINYILSTCANPLPLQPKYDYVFSISVLEHLPRQQFLNAITNLFNTTKPKGKLIITLDYGDRVLSPESLHHHDICNMLDMFNSKIDRQSLAFTIDHIKRMHSLWQDYYPFTKDISPSGSLGIVIGKDE